MRLLLPLMLSSLLQGIVLGQWTRTAGPEGGHINALSAKDDTLYAATDGGIYVSTDRAASWKEIGTGLPEARIYGLALHGGLIYANVEGYLWYTADGGSQWVKTQSAYRTTSALAASASAVYTAGLAGEIAVSRDTGETWERVGLEGYSDYLTTAFDAEGDRVLAATYEGTFHSRDAGRTWERGWTPRFMSPAWDVLIWGPHYLAATDSGLMQSRDTGKTWTRSPLPGDVHDAPEGLSLCCLARDGSTLYAGRPGGAILRSVDSGKVWEPFNLPADQYRLQALAAFGGILFAGNTHLGVYSHVGPGTPAVLRNKGLIAMRAQRVIAGEKNLIVGSQSGTPSHSSLFLSEDGGLGWSRLSFPAQSETWAVQDMARGSGRIYAQANYRQFLYSDDDGKTWGKFPMEDFLFGKSVAVQGDTIHAGFSNGYFLSSLDRGRTWSAPETARSLDDVTAVAALGNSVVASGGNGLAYSQDLGKNWTRAFAVSGYFMCLGTAGPAILAGKSDDVLISHDEGVTWASFSQGLPKGPGPSPLTFHYQDGVMLVGTAFHGVFKRRSGDARWQPVNEGLRSHYITSLAVKDGWLYAATRGGGVWKHPWNAFAAAAEGSKDFNGLAMSKLVPALGAEWIDVTVPEAGRYELSLRGLDGKLLRTFAVDFGRDGTHRLNLGKDRYRGLKVAHLRKSP